MAASAFLGEVSILIPLWLGKSVAPTGLPIGKSWRPIIAAYWAALPPLEWERLSCLPDKEGWEIRTLQATNAWWHSRGNMGMPDTVDGCEIR